MKSSGGGGSGIVPAVGSVFVPGLGQLINDLAERYDLPGTYAAICFVILVSVLFFFLTDRIERWLRPAT